MNTEKLSNLAMNDNGFIFDPESGYSYTANETGIFILKRMADGMQRQEIFEQLSEVYDVSEDNFNSDYAHYLLMLEALDLISLKGDTLESGSE
jgi:hypothetical protein